jgi:hypothetical protein
VLLAILSISNLAFAIAFLKAGKKSWVLIFENGAVLYGVENLWFRIFIWIVSEFDG